MRPMKCPSKPINIEAQPWHLGYYASPKIDGIRCIISDRGPVSASGKPFPNPTVHDLLSDLPLGLDGELVCGQPNDSGVYRRTMSCIMSQSPNPDWVFRVFDWAGNQPTTTRLAALLDLRDSIEPRANVTILSHGYVESLAAAESFYQRQVHEGYEGACFRRASARYKHGRSTYTEGALLRIKKREDAEATIIDVEPAYHNANESSLNAWSLTERRTLQENKYPLPMVGSFLARDLQTGVQFRVGTFRDVPHSLRKVWWTDRKTLLGRTFKYSYHSHDNHLAPREPVFLGFRDLRDMD